VFESLVSQGEMWCRGGCCAVCEEVLKRVTAMVCNSAGDCGACPPTPNPPEGHRAPTSLGRTHRAARKGTAPGR